MESYSNAPAKNSAHAGIILLVSLGVTLLLFFVDEGYYDFRWMKDPRNWLAFLIYTTALTAGQVVVHEIVLRKYFGVYKPILTHVGGVVLGMIVLVMWLG